VAVALLALLTLKRNEVWADPVTLWSDAAAKAPLTWAPYYALGDALRDRGDCKGAVKVYRRAIELRPDDSRARVNLGVCLAQTGAYDEARAALLGALTVDPGSVDARNDLGFLANLQRQPEVAAGWFREVLQRDAGNLIAHMNLAVLEEQVFGRPEAALALCREVEQKQPGIPAVRDCIRRLQPPG
jgi:Flp pilus assembly protein TadD